jgi:hypothetical protein
MRNFLRHLRRACGIGILAVGSGLSAPPATAQDAPALLYVESAAAPRGIQQERLETCLRLLMQDLGLSNQPLPLIAVVHIGEAEARRAGLQNVSVKLRLNTDPAADAQPYYELWLVGEPRTADYTFSLDYLLERHFSLQREPAAQQATVARVVRFLDATVSARRK